MRVCPRCCSMYSGDGKFCALDGEKLLVQEEDPLVGKSVDQYLILSRLGGGATSNVYRAVHAMTGAEHAVKVLLGDMASQAGVSQRFKREAQTIGKIRHPHVI